MKMTSRLTTWMTTGALLACLTLSSATAVAGPIGLIDDFNTPGLSEYTFYKRLDQNAGTTNILFSDATGTLDATSVGSTGAEQVLFLRNDGVSLGIFEELQIDGPATKIGTANDLGLAIGATPTGLAGAGDNRATADFLFISFRATTQLNSRGFNGGAEVGQVQNFGVNATKLFIARTGTNTVDLGWYDGLMRNISRSVTVANTSVFDNVGFYADLRNDGGGFTGLDNLQIIPEPASVTMLLCSLGVLVIRRR
jgi:hypothetical protein